MHEEVLLLIFVKSRRSRCFNAINTSERKEILIRFVFKSFSTFFFSTKTFLAASSLLVVTFFSSWFHFAIFHGSPCALLFNVCLGFFCCAAFCCATSSPLHAGSRVRRWKLYTHELAETPSSDITHHAPVPFHYPAGHFTEWKTTVTAVVFWEKGVCVLDIWKWVRTLKKHGFFKGLLTHYQYFYLNGARALLLHYSSLTVLV